MKTISTFVFKTTALKRTNAKNVDIIWKVTADPIFLLVCNLLKEHNI